MKKVLDILSAVLKLATIVVGSLATSPDAAVLLHLDGPMLGKIVAGLGTAASLVKLGQVKVEKVTDAQLNK